MEKLKVGIIGCGLIGNERAKALNGDPGTYLSCACDVVPSRAEDLIREYANGKAILYKDWQEMLETEELDVVIIATPNRNMEEITHGATQRKIHILCEKPLGRNLHESKKILEDARRSNVILKTGFNHRHHPAIFKAHQLVKNKAIGEVFFARCVYGHGGRPGYEKEWRASKDICGGGELLDQGVHVVDLFRWFLGDFEEAFGYTPTCYWDMEVEDNAFALFSTTRGQNAVMHTSWTQWKNRFTFEVFGEAGYLLVDGLGGSYGTETLRIGKRRKFLYEREMDSTVQYMGGPPDEELIEFSGPDISWEGEWKEFVSAIRENRKPLGNGDDGLEAMRMIEAVYRSSRESRPIRIQDIK